MLNMPVGMPFIIETDTNALLHRGRGFCHTCAF